MNLHSLPKTTITKKKRLGRGHGSGKVKTSGRGTKGTKARYTVPLTSEGGALPLIKRIPFLRGKQKFKALKPKPLTINVSVLNRFDTKRVIDEKFLIEKGVVDETKAKKRGIKVLGDGELKVALVVKMPVSKSAKEKIEKAGGKVG